jgi:hypothetical protein
MSVIEGTTSLKSWKGSYDFAVDGGVAGTITLRSNDGKIPIASVIEGGYVDVITALTGAGASVAVQAEGAADTLAVAAISGAPWSTTGRKSVIPAFTGATTLKTTAARSPATVISAANLTAGKFDVVLYYR